MSTLAPTNTLRFADHVRACRIDEQVILLDLKRDTYQGVGGVQSASLSDFILDWPAASTPPPHPPSEQSSAVSSLLGTLAGQAMLVNACTSPPSRSQFEEPLESWCHSDIGTQSNIAARDMLQMAWSAAAAACWLQCQSLAQIERNVMRLRNRTARHFPTRSDELHRHVAKYMRMRPLVFSARDRCLHDSLSLIRFLAAQALFPQWVIGVRTRPFAAHSWVQSGNLVLNDLHEHVRSFHPILVV